MNPSSYKREMYISVRVTLVSIQNSNILYHLLMGPFLVVKLYDSILISENSSYKPKCSLKRMDLRLPVRGQ